MKTLDLYNSYVMLYRYNFFYSSLAAPSIRNVCVRDRKRKAILVQMYNIIILSVPTAVYYYMCARGKQ